MDHSKFGPARRGLIVSWILGTTLIAQSGTWTQVGNAPIGTPFQWYDMAVCSFNDPAVGRWTVAIGGNTGVISSAVVAWNESAGWVTPVQPGTVTPASLPTPTTSGAAAYDVARGELVFWGGNQGGGIGTNSTYVGVLSLGPGGILELDWGNSPIAPGPTATAPQPRQEFAMCHVDGVGVVLLGGAPLNGGNLSGTEVGPWLWQGDGDWIRLSSLNGLSVNPSLRSNAMVWDDRRQRVVLFGGDIIGGFDSRTMEFEFDGASPPAIRWFDSSPPLGPTPGNRAQHGMAYNPADGMTYLFGGRRTGINNLADLWAWNGTYWREVDPQANPSGRRSFGMSYDQGAESAIVIGGSNIQTPQPAGNTWLFDADEYSPQPVGLIHNVAWEWSRTCIGESAGTIFARDPGSLRKGKGGGTTGQLTFDTVVLEVRDRDHSTPETITIALYPEHPTIPGIPDQTMPIPVASGTLPTGSSGPHVHRLTLSGPFTVPLVGNGDFFLGIDLAAAPATNDGLEIPYVSAFGPGADLPGGGLDPGPPYSPDNTFILCDDGTDSAIVFEPTSYLPFDVFHDAPGGGPITFTTQATYPIGMNGTASLLSTAFPDVTNPRADDIGFRYFRSDAGPGSLAVFVYALFGFGPEVPLATYTGPAFDAVGSACMSPTAIIIGAFTPVVGPETIYRAPPGFLTPFRSTFLGLPIVQQAFELAPGNRLFASPCGLRIL